jgi:hypothetical protein
MALSPFPEDLKSAKLHVQAGSPLAEVFLIDHEFALKERSIGDLDVEVEPGVYNVKARLGDATVEQLVVLNQDQELDLRDELSLASPAPIEGASPAHESAVRVAAEESAKVARRIGKGAQIFLLTRSESGQSPLIELTLHRRNGKLIEDLAVSGSSAAGRTVSVDPGTYFLRWDDSSGIAAEQAVQAVKGWQTQVFMLDEAPAGSEPGRHHVSVQMSRSHFDPDDEMLRRTEEARAALADERKVASKEANEALFAKADNPILGLFGAHLMLLAQDAVEKAADEESLQDTERVQAPVGFDQTLFDTAVRNLRRLLGAAHPDVMALSTKTSNPPKRMSPLSAPPLLWRSWLLLVEASNDSPELVPWTICRQVAKLLPMRPFLVWSPVDENAASRWKGQLDEALAPARIAEDEARRRLSEQLLVPRVAIDKVLDSAN